MDKADGTQCIVIANICLWDCIYDQFHCYLLSCIKSHPIWNNGMYIHICLIWKGNDLRKRKS